ncbi:hypothetical protein [Amycolatopsis circi]|uniref:hypothetical protein n=1 Tax=Amycolatopsis circi TaxID=871959 RepID=UPI001ABF2577|nr:hypothetical protein [Amycolatopsis circi]
MRNSVSANGFRITPEEPARRAHPGHADRAAALQIRDHPQQRMQRRGPIRLRLRGQRSHQLLIPLCQFSSDLEAAVGQGEQAASAVRTG